MPFGLCNATATFQRLMSRVLADVTQKYGSIIMCYVDDVVIATPTINDHIDRLNKVFRKLRQAGLKCKPSKCEMLKSEVVDLGRLINQEVVQLDPEKTHTVPGEKTLL